MARTDTLGNYLTDIATAIKTKKGDETPINASKFDEEITNLPSGGGVDEYFNETSNKNGNPNFINHFIKKIPMIDASNYTSMYKGFQNCYALETIPLLDTSNVTNMNYAFDSCSSLMEIPQLDTSKVTNVNNMFSNCGKLSTVPFLNFEKVTNVGYIFSGCKEILNLGGFKDLGKAYSTTQGANYNNYKLDLTPCTKLTHDSLMNVINNLYDIKTKGCNTQKLVLGADNLSKLTAEEINIAVEKGWSVA